MVFLGLATCIVSTISSTIMFYKKGKAMKEEICALRIYIYEHCHEEMKEEMLEKYIKLWRNR